MKKNIFIICCLFIIYTFMYHFDTTSSDDKKNIKEDEIRGIYFSYIEISDYFNNNTEESIKNKIDNIIYNLKKDNFNMILLHVRSFSDALYYSSIFPSSISITNDENKKLSFDILKYFIEKAHDENIKVHAWINPYRIRNKNTNIEITNNNPAYKWLNTTNVYKNENGIYYNPASDEVTDLILKGIDEILKNYNVDGIHFDDYFYPDDKIDLELYKEYKNSGGVLTLKEFRYDNILKMLDRVEKLVHSYNKSLIFSISPDGNLENNYNNNYLDVKRIIENKSVDLIMPQLYYGFYNENKPFVDTTYSWNNLINNNIKMVPVLALYKSGNIDNYAKSGKDEWTIYNNIISSQINVIKRVKNYGGYILFRYDNFYNPNNKNQINEVENYRSFLNDVEM